MKHTIKRGFTLGESLVVLFLVSILLLFLTIQPRHSVKESIETRIFFDELSSSLKYMQQLAILQAYTTSIYFDRQANRIIFRNLYSEQGNYQLSPPAHIQLNSSDTIHYYPTSRVSQFRTFNFYNMHTEENIKLVFQLGNGQFEIQQ